MKTLNIYVKNESLQLSMFVFITYTMPIQQKENKST